MKKARSAKYRFQYGAASVELPVSKPADASESRRLSEWLSRRGEPNLSQWKKRTS